MVDVNNAIVTPEDEGTGVPSNDEADFVSAGHVSGLVAQSNISDHVERGLNFSVDWVDNLLTMSGGLAFVWTDENITVQDEVGEYSRTWQYGSTYVVHGSSTANIPLYEGENHVYLEINLGENNDVRYTVKQSQNAPSNPSLYLGWVNTTTEEFSEENRAPAIEARSLDVDNIDLENVDVAEGNFDNLYALYAEIDDLLTQRLSVRRTYEDESPTDGETIWNPRAFVSSSQSDYVGMYVYQNTADASRYPLWIEGSEGKLLSLNGEGNLTVEGNISAVNITADSAELIDLTSENFDLGTGTIDDATVTSLTAEDATVTSLEVTDELIIPALDAHPENPSQWQIWGLK